MTIFSIGLSDMKRLPRELVLVLLSCFVIRPLVMYFVTMPFELDPVMRKDLRRRFGPARLLRDRRSRAHLRR